MPDFDFAALLRAFGDAAGWTVAVVVLIFNVVGLWRGWVVPGHVYEREVARGDRAEGALEAATDATERASQATKSATDTALAVAGQLGALQTAIRDIHREP